MIVWTCNHCHAEIPQQEKPRECPLCGQGKKGFDEHEKPDPSPEDKKYTEVYEQTIKDLEKYDEGCEPSTLKYCCDE